MALIAAASGMNAAPAAVVMPSAPDASPAPTTSEELIGRLQQLREHYRPYLQSLPQPLNVRTQVDLSGTWRCKWEVEDFRKGPRPAAPDWYRVDLDDSDWQETTVPEWRYDKSAPFGTKPAPPPNELRPDSRILWYRTAVTGVLPQADRRVSLVFSGVAWEAEVWFNGTFLGRHQAYWEPFRFDVTSMLKEKNVLAVRVLAGPNLGEPVFGWSVLPCVLAVEPRIVRDASRSVVGQRELFGFASSCFLSGIGIHREVYLETTGKTIVSGLFVRGDPSTGKANIRVETDSAVDKELVFDVQLLPENFKGPSYVQTESHRVPQGAGQQVVTVPMPGARLWQPTDPCLYRCRITIRDNQQAVDSHDVLFGCRSFRLATAGDNRANLPEGTFLLNDQPIYLRGAGGSPALNAFWYWHQDDKLLDTVLMMKAANFNAVRANEHIQFPEVRELLDRLGMLSEQDMSGAGNTSSPVPMNVITNLMAHLARECYNNPGVVLLTAGEETHCDPTAVVAAVLAADPERIVKPISGNMESWATAYEPPPGYKSMPSPYWTNVVDDFHCYNGWYHRGADMAKLSPLYPPGRLVTVGEFGAEALDSYATMQHYPSHLQPPPITANALWGHAQVKKGDPKLTVGLRGQVPRTLGQYIEASQNYQADVLAEQATGFRLSPRRIGGSFVFHFIDGLPDMWPKSIVSFDLMPKAGYFALAQVNLPVVPLFQIVDQGKSLALWVANDRSDAIPGGRVAWDIEAGGKSLLKGEKKVDVAPLDATPVEKLDLSPILDKTAVATISLVLNDADGKPVSRYRREVYLKAWQPPVIEVLPPAKALVPKLPDASAAGDPGKVDWSKSAPLAGWREVEGSPTQRKIEAHIAHDGQYLYVKLEERVATADFRSDEGVWSGEDWELFLAKEQAKPYRQLGINPKGAFQQVTCLKQPNGAPLPLCEPKVVSDVGKDRWTVLVAMPLENLVSGGLKSGDVFYGNFYRHAGSADDYLELIAWSPNYKSEFHLPERFGELRLQ